MWNLEKWYRRSYFQGKNRDIDIENRCVDTGSEGESRMNWKIGIDIYTLFKDAQFIVVQFSIFKINRTSYLMMEQELQRTDTQDPLESNFNLL